MEIVVLKTYEIPDPLWQKITDGFNESFDLHATVEGMKHGFCVRNKLGYGYHAIAISDDGDVMGYNVFSPVFYKNNLKTVVSGSTYVRPKYRNHEMLFMNMIQALRKKVIEDGYKVEIGVPNHNSEKFALKILKFNPVAELDYYILPFNISHNLQKSSLKWLDGFTRVFAYIHLFFNALFSRIVQSNEKETKYEIELNSDYWKYRFGEGHYDSYTEGKYHAYWLIRNENDATASYLMDFRENGKRTYRALFKAVQTITKKHKVDAILFVGFLNLKQLLLLKVPKRFVPKRLPLTYYVLNKEDRELYADMRNKNNWNFSLMNFDVR